MKYQIASISHKGQRKQNEDSYKAVLCEKEYYPLTGYIVVADGMGGMAAGDVASRTAVVSFEQELLENINTLDDLKPGTIKKLLRHVITEVNKNVNTEGNSSASTEDMGTTLTVVLLFNDKYMVANVGDSRAYLINEDNVAQITKDHTALTDALENGSITEKEASKYLYANALTRSIGSNEMPEVDIFPLSKASDDDILLVSSDGFHKFIKEEFVKKSLISSSDLQHTLQELVNIAMENGSDDNLTAIVLRFKSDKYKTIPRAEINNTVKSSPKRGIYYVIVILLTIILLFLGLVINEELEYFDLPVKIVLLQTNNEFSILDPDMSPIIFHKAIVLEQSFEKYLFKNTVNRKVYLTDITLSGPNQDKFIVELEAAVVELIPGENFSIPILFNPTITGDFEAFLVIEVDNGNSQSFKIPIFGNAIEDSTKILPEVEISNED